MVRLFLVISVFAAGFGLVVYILLWILTPVDEGGAVPATAAPRRLRRPSGGQLAGIGLMVIGIAFLLAIGGFWFGRLARMADRACRNRFRSAVGAQPATTRAADGAFRAWADRCRRW